MRLQTLLYSLMSFQTKRYSSLNKEYSDLGKIVRVYDQYKGALDSIEESEEIIADGSDRDLVDLAKEEKLEAQAKLPGLEEELKVLLIPKDPADDKTLLWNYVPGQVVMKPLFL